jgi:hypothetical protein
MKPAGELFLERRDFGTRIFGFRFNGDTHAPSNAN